MKLFDTIKSWFNSSDKTELDHFDLGKIENIITSIRVDPFLKFMQEQIEELLRNISISSKEDKGLECKFIVINGVSGSGKTNLVYEHLKYFLLATGVIKRNQEIIDKIASHDLNDFGLHGKTIEEVIADRVHNCKDGILILDEFTPRDKNAQAIADLINELHKDKTFLYTAVILMGEYRSNYAFIKAYSLDNIFPEKFHLNFYTPNFSQIGDIFEAYVNREGEYILTDKAKSSLIFYFNKTKLTKETKADLNRQGIKKFPFRERNYVYTSEMFPIYKDIIAIKKDNNKSIDQQDILNANSYKKLLDDLNDLDKYIR
jgi:hypothetical protein